MMTSNDERGPKIPEDVRRAFLHRDPNAPWKRTMTPINQGALVPSEYEAPLNPSDVLTVRGVGRVADEPRAVLVLLSERPTDDEIRRVHNCLRAKLLTLAQSETDAHRIARGVRGCTTDAQYQELVGNIEAAVAAKVKQQEFHAFTREFLVWANERLRQWGPTPRVKLAELAAKARHV